MVNCVFDNTDLKKKKTKYKNGKLRPIYLSLNFDSKTPKVSEVSDYISVIGEHLSTLSNVPNE